jgi:hypothetical protein
MSRKSVVVMSSMPETINFLGAPVRVDNKYTSSEYLTSVSITTRAFAGRVTLLASIMTNPTEGDWFVVPLTDAGYIEYPTPGHTNRDSSTRGFTFKGRYVWVRIKIDRDYLLAPTATPIQIATYGAVDRVLLNL